MITKKDMETLLGTAELAFTTAKSDEEIKTPLLAYNYDDARLDQCLEIHRQAKEAYQKQIKERSEQFQATEKLEKAMDEANPVYIEHISLTRFALRNHPKKKTKFALSGKRRDDIYGWIEQAEVFYDNMLGDEEVLTNIAARFGLTKEKLEKGKQLVLKVKAANKNQEKEKSDSQQSTEDRDRLFNELSERLSEFFLVCKFALAHKPQLLERLGYLQLSGGYRRRENNPEEENETENEG